MVEPDSGRLLAAVRALPVRCEVRRFVDVGADMTDLLQFGPEILLFDSSTMDEDFAGMVRVVRSALGHPPVILVATAEAETEATAMAERIGARVLVAPERAGALAATLEQTLAGADPRRHGAFLEIARGLADELNNPLMYLSGHLQLLARGLQDDPRRDQVLAARDGVQRITDTVARLRLLVEAETGAPRPTNLTEAAALALALAPSVGPLRIPPGRNAAPEVRVSAVPALQPALEGLARWLEEVAALGGYVAVAVEPPPRPALVVDIDGGVVDAWDIPQTFAPYALHRGLKGSPHGLTLFLVHTAVHASGAMAIARRRPEGGLRIELRWP